MAQNDRYEEDDGRVVADMSDFERTPLLIPRFENLRRGARAERSDFKEPVREENTGSDFYHEPPVITKEERNAMIKGGLAAGLLIVGAIALAFGIFIFLLTRLAN